MSRSLMLAAAASVALAACTMNGMPAAAPMADMTPEGRQSYVEMAAASDFFEIRSSQMALARARNPAVRAFARMMVDHHSLTTQQLSAAAAASGVMASSV